VINAAASAGLVAALPVLAHAGRAVLDDFHRAASLARFPAGHLLLTEGDEARAMLLVREGRVRVFKLGQGGREITLYRFGPGEGCILTATALMSRQPFPATAAVEAGTEAVIIPAEVFRRWVHQHEAWRTFVFDQLARRMTAVLSLVDELLFQRMDSRVASFLTDRSRAGNPIRVTHQEIAAELGSSREVISRIIEGLAGAGVIRAARGQVEVVDPPSLAARSVR
jgi:CRP/FNR family transcriptional regulator